MKLSHRKRAYKADAIQWDGTNTEVVFDAYPGAELFGSRHIMVRHAEGISTLNIGDWVVRGENGEVKSYSDDVFKVKYEPNP